ncbi:MAG: hypothetical protein ACRYGA_00615 [Janthinobacterium lividum]
MATQKSTQPARDEAIEHLLGEIASTANFTEMRLRNTPGDCVELYEYEVDLLRQTVARMGWMADIALRRLGSIGSMVHSGNAEDWLLSPKMNELLAIEAQS